MWKYFKQFGLVLDVFVPKKCTKLGKAFGFICYKEIKDVNKLLRETRSVAVGPSCITINEAKYKRTSPTSKLGVSKVRRLHHPPCSSTWKSPNQLLHANQENGIDRTNNTKTGQKSKCVVVEPVEGEIKYWLRCCVVGKVLDTNTLNDIGSLLQHVGFMECKAKYAEGFRYILECPNPDLMSKMLVEGKNKLSRWF